MNAFWNTGNIVGRILIGPPSIITVTVLSWISRASLLLS